MSKKTAKVCRATRRYVDIYDAEFSMLRATSIDAVEPLCVGDLVEYQETTDSQYIVTALEKRNNILKRSSASRTKILSANVDHLLIVTAPGPICRPQTIDRVLIAAAAENIPTSLVWNKSDLDDEFSAAKPIRDSYLAAGYSILESSALNSEGINSLQSFLLQENFKHVVLTGVSGVGKSSLLNALVETAEARTQEVSTRGGHGRQTTSSGFGYPYPREGIGTLMLCDLPGVQQFGLAHLDEAGVRNGYPEFYPHSSNCRFSNCSHFEEPDCAVRSAVKEGLISTRRYASYQQIVTEHRQMYY